jgi:hypothetical protein
MGSSSQGGPQDYKALWVRILRRYIAAPGVSVDAWLILEETKEERWRREAQAEVDEICTSFNDERVG